MGTDETHKLNGQIAAPTPRGANLVSVSISFETSILVPINIAGIPHALSTTCSPPIKQTKQKNDKAPHKLA